MFIDKEKIVDIFFNDVCGKSYVMVGGEPLYLSIYYRVRENNAIVKEKLPENKENYNEQTIIDISNFSMFQEKLYQYVKKYLSSNLLWTNYWIADTQLDDIKLALIGLWTNATWQDYENPIGLIDRYISFLDKDKLHQILAEGKEIFHKNDTVIIMKTKTNDWELETPYKFVLEASDSEGKKEYPGVHYGIHNQEAYIYAVQGTNYIHNYGKNDYENETMREIRQKTRQEGKKDDYRGAEPLAIMSLICFLETLKKSGIQKVNIANILPLRYNSKTELHGSEFSDEIQNSATNRLLLQIRRIMLHHSDGIKLLNVPGETGDFLSINIKDYKPKGEIIEEMCEKIDKSLGQYAEEER